MTNDPNPSPIGTPEWTPEEWESVDKAETAKEKTWDESAGIV